MKSEPAFDIFPKIKPYEYIRSNASRRSSRFNMYYLIESVASDVKVIVVADELGISLFNILIISCCLVTVVSNKSFNYINLVETPEFLSVVTLLSN